MGKTFLGLTLGCARCHDHKFDAISSQDYYSLAGFLESSSYREVHFQWQEHNRQIADRLAAFDRETAARSRRQRWSRFAARSTGWPITWSRRRNSPPTTLHYRPASRTRHANSQPGGAGSSRSGSLAFWADQLRRAAKDRFDPFSTRSRCWRGMPRTANVSCDHKLLESVIATWRAEQARAATLPPGADGRRRLRSAVGSTLGGGRFGLWTAATQGRRASPAAADSKVGHDASQLISVTQESVAIGNPTGDFPGMLRTPTLRSARRCCGIALPGAGRHLSWSIPTV